MGTFLFAATQRRVHVSPLPPDCAAGLGAALQLISVRYDGRRTTDDGRRTTDDGRRTTGGRRTTDTGRQTVHQTLDMSLARSSSHSPAQDGQLDGPSAQAVDTSLTDPVFDLREVQSLVMNQLVS